MSTPTPQTHHKTCPRCGRVAALTAPFCEGCGREYQTKFSPPVEQTQFIQRGDPSGHATHTPPAGGYREPSPVQMRRNPDDIQLVPGSHNPGVALLLSLIVIGIGQMYNRQVVKGGVFLLCALVLVPVTFGIAWFPIAIMSSIDAYQIGKKLDEGRVVGQWELF